MSVSISILTVEKLWKKHPKISTKIKSLLKEVIPKTPLNDLLETKINLDISILLTNNQQIEDLNKAYRHKNQPTNVLSFPLLDGKKIKNGNFTKLEIGGKNLALGDIVIAYQTLESEAKEQNKLFEHHLFHLIIHSLLHLIGFDHINDKDAKIMENLEIKLLKELGIKNPY